MQRVRKLQRSGHLANRSEQVGRNLQFHPGAMVTGVFPEAVRPEFGATQGYQSLQFLAEGFKLETFWAPPTALALRMPGMGAALMQRLAELPRSATWDAILSCHRSLGTVRPRRGASLDPGDKSIEDCVYEMNYGIRVVPTGMHFETLKNINTNYISWNKIINEIADYGNIFVLDLPAGIDSNILEALPADSEIILVTNSTMPSVADALKLRILLNELNLDILGFVLNMWYEDNFLLSPQEIESLLEIPMISIIPYDREMDRALALGRSVVEINSTSPTSNAIMQLAADILGKEYQPVEPDKRSILNRIKKFVGMLPE